MCQKALLWSKGLNKSKLIKHLFTILFLLIMLISLKIYYGCSKACFIKTFLWSTQKFSYMSVQHTCILYFG